jgi:hypothetical protein
VELVGELLLANAEPQLQELLGGRTSRNQTEIRVQCSAST